MNVRLRIVFALFAAALLALGSACGTESGEENNAPNNANNQSDAGNNGGPDVDLVEVPQDWEYDSEYHLRFTEFYFKAGTPGSDLNNLLRTNLRDQHEKYPVVVLIHLKDIDAEAGVLDLRGGAGLKADLECDPETFKGGECEYKWDPDSPEEYTADAPFNAETGELNGSLALLDFVATFELDGEVKKAVIPVKDIAFDAEVLPFAYEDAEGEVIIEVAIEGAELSGHITQEDAENTAIEINGSEVYLDALLDTGEMNADIDGDGTNDAWALEGVFSARETIVVE